MNGILSVPPSPPLGLGAHLRRRLLRGLEEPSWRPRTSAGLSAILDWFGAKGRHVGADFKSVIWMFGLFKIF